MSVFRGHFEEALIWLKVDDPDLTQTKQVEHIIGHKVCKRNYVTTEIDATWTFLKRTELRI